MISRPAYRTRQFFVALRPRITDAERESAAKVLGEELMTLFESMALRDQRHCLDVYKMLRANGCEDAHVLMAALVHDAGKGRLAGAKVRLWHRVAYVLLAATAPSLLNRLVNGGGRSGLASLHHHCERGAVLADALGAPTPVVDMIRRLDDEGDEDDRLRLLRTADDAC